jgi:hypothetical protein
VTFLNFKERIEYLIANNVLMCWKCKNTVPFIYVVSIDLDSERITYRCECGNTGFRTFNGIAVEMQKKNVTRPASLFGDCEVDINDRSMPVPITKGGRRMTWLK